jgi:tetratricopeptide (TPR) repeat protein
MSRASASSTPTRPKPTPRPSASPTPTPLPVLVRIEGLKNTPQKYNNCGPANLSIVLKFYGHEVDQLEIGEALKPNYDDRNVSPYELVNYVHETSDQEAMVLFGLDLEQLKALLSAQFPVIVEKGLDLSDTHGWMGHYLTLFGYDQDEQVFMGLDTFLGPWDSVGRDFEFDALDTLWAQFNRTTIIVYPAERKEELAAILGPQMLDDRSMWMAAAEQAQEALNADAQDAFAWFDLGASLYHLADLGGDDTLYMRAAATFDRAREIGLPWRTLWYQFEPYQAYMAAGRIDEVLALTEAVMTTSGGRNIEETYLFQGHALLASGDQVAAERAYERALRLNPGLDAAREALLALANSTARGSG